MTPPLIQVARPRLPPAREVLPYLRQIDQNAWYSNHGPLARALQSRLEQHWGLGAGCVALLSSATSAITVALLASGARPGSRCLMPSWTFVASAAAVSQAGLVPHFVDVQPDSWAPDPTELQVLASQHDVGAILAVSPFGAPLDLAAWDALADATGLPVIIDAAAAFDTLRDGGPMPAGRCPVIVSLHATKVFGIGEGGALLSRDPGFVDSVRRLAQFGFLGTREALVPGLNAKLSEYGAAVGLASLDAWPETRTRWSIATNAYRARLRLDCGVQMTPSFGNRFVSSTLSVLWPEERPDPAAALATQGVASLRWWGPGCHAQPAFQGCPREPLPVTEALAPRTVGLPFWQDLKEAQIDSVCLALAHTSHARSRRPARRTLVAV